MFEMATHYSVKETRAIAREEGEKNKAIQVALNLLKAGVTKEIISQSTGLSIEELEKLVSSPIKES